jgi:putative LysE/RhtB family amino acid efflux pump
VQELLPLLAAAGPAPAGAAALVAGGVLAGVAVSAPPGPVGGLCIERTLRLGFRPGLCTGCGALLADVTYAAVAAFGLAQVVTPRGVLREAIAVVVAALLAWCGVTLLARARTGGAAARADEVPARRGQCTGFVAGTFLLALATPGTLPAFVALFAGLGLAAGAAEMPGGPVLVVAGVAAGAALWWLALCAAVHRFRDHARGWLRGMDYACGALLLAGAAGAVWSGFAG